MDRVKEWVGQISARSPLAIAGVVFGLILVIVVGISLSTSAYDENFFANILAEAHGMLFDLLIIGILIFWLNSLGERHREIRRYQEEIEDYLGWSEPEATFRIVGNFKRLNREEVSKIALSRAYLKGANLGGVNLQDAELGETNLQEANLEEADLQSAGLWETQMQGTRLSKANLKGAYLWEAKMQGAELWDSKLQGADLQFADLRGAKLEGAEYDKWTEWPEGFNPKSAGAILVD